MKPLHKAMNAIAGYNHAKESAFLRRSQKDKGDLYISLYGTGPYGEEKKWVSWEDLRRVLVPTIDGRIYSATCLGSLDDAANAEHKSAIEAIRDCPLEYRRSLIRLLGHEVKPGENFHGMEV